MELKVYNSKSELAASFSEYLSEMVKMKAVVHVALSGGSTPRVIFDMLASGYKDIITWEKIHFYWGDERCVPPDDQESNFKMTQDHLFKSVDVPQANIHRIMGENEPAAEAVRYSGVLDLELPKSGDIPQFDLVILGMGEDGHTASIFPHEIELWNSNHNCVVASHPDTGQKRVSITGKIINNARNVVFLVTGEGKAEKVDQIINRSGTFGEYPASLVAPDSGNLIWFMDEAAANKL